MGHITIVLVSTLLIVAITNGSPSVGTYRSLFDFPADALGINDLEGQEDAPLPAIQKSSGGISKSSISETLDQLRRSIPGEPDVDYPIFKSPPDTEFSCKSRAIGYYADVEARCQVFRVCTNTDLSGKGFAFLCPNGTLFNQEVFVCDWYQHVDCNESENHYGKNDELNMKINSMTDMMAVVHEMVNFPLNPNSVPPTLIPNSQPTFQTTGTTKQISRRPSIVPTTSPFTTQTKQTPNHSTGQFTSSRFPSTATTPPLTTAPGQFGTGAHIYNTHEATPATPTKPQRPNTDEFGTHTITQEGDFDINSKTSIENTRTDTKNTFSNQPLFISSLGELSTDPKNKFDINKSKIIRPDENNVVTAAPLTKEEQLKQSLAESFKKRPNTATPSENTLAQGLQQVLQQNPDFQVQVLSGEPDLLKFIEQILQRNPDLTADKLNVILSKESEAILEILNDAVKHSQTPSKTRDTDILDKIQVILNRYKNNGDSQTSDAGLSNTLRRLAQQIGTPIFSGEADLVQFIERILQENPGYTYEKLNSVIGEEFDNILRYFNEKRQRNNGQSGKVDLLEAIRFALQRNRYQNTAVTGVPQTTPLQSRQPQNTAEAVQSGEADLLENVLRRIVQQSGIAIFSGEADLVQFIERLLQQNPDFTRKQLAAIISGELNSILSYLNQKGQQNGQFVESGEADLLEAIQIILQKYRGQNTPATGRPQTVTTPFQSTQTKLTLPQSTESNPVQPTFAQFSQQAVQSGEADLLENTLRQIAQQSGIAIFSGEADLVQFIERLLQHNPDITREQLAIIISGEADSILSILNENRRNRGFAVQSGEADLLEAIQIVLQKYRGQKTTSFVPQTVTAQPQSQQQFTQQSIRSGEGDLLQNALQRIQQQSRIPIFSGEADLVSFIERLVQLNPDFTPEQIANIINRESGTIVRLLNQKRKHSGATSAESGEADLLEVIQNLLQKYRGQNGSVTERPQTLTTPFQATQFQSNQPQTTQSQSNQAHSKTKTKPQLSQQAVQSGEADLLENVLRRIVQQSGIAIFSGEADLVQFIERLLQQNPDFTRKQLAAIISGELNSILSYLNQNRQQNGQFVESGEADLLEAIQIVLQKYRGQNTPFTGRPPPVTTPFQSIQIHSTQPQLSQLSQGHSTSQPQPPQQTIQSGEADLLGYTLRRIAQQSGIAIFSGEADLVSFIERLVKQYPEFTREQLAAIISGELDSILSILNQKRQQNGGQFIESGEADLLEAIQIVLQRYRDQQIPPRPQAPITQSGHGDSLESALRRLIQESGIPIFSGEADLVSFIERFVQQNPGFTREQLAAIISGEIYSILQTLRENSRTGFLFETTEADLLDALQITLKKYPGQSAQQQIVQSGGSDLLENTLRRILQQSQIPIFSGEADLVQFIERFLKKHPELTREQLAAIVSGEIDSILRYLNEKRQQGMPVESGEAILTEALEIILQKYNNVMVSANNSIRIGGNQHQLQPPLKTSSLIQKQLDGVSITDINRLQLVAKPQTSSPHAFVNQNVNNAVTSTIKPISTIGANHQGTTTTVGVSSIPQATPKPINHVVSQLQNQAFIPTNANTAFGVEKGGTDRLRQTLEQISLRIPNQNQPLLSGDENLLQFMDRLQQSNPSITLNKLNAISGGEASSILKQLNDKAQQNTAIGMTDLLDSMQQVLQKYRLDTELAPPLREPVFAGEDDLLETLQKIQQKSTVPIVFHESDLLKIVRRIEQKNPSLTPSQLNEIIRAGIEHILQILYERRQAKDRFDGFYVMSGEEDLLVAIQYYVETIVKPDGTPVSPDGVSVVLPPPGIQSSQNDLLRTIQRIDQQVQVPIFSGEADLVQFIELIKQRNPEFTPTQLSSIIDKETDTIVHMLNTQPRASANINADPQTLSSGDAQLLNAIFRVLKKYRRNYLSTPAFAPMPSTPAFAQGINVAQTTEHSQQLPRLNPLQQDIKSTGQVSTHSVHGQLTAITSGQSNTFYQLSNENQANAGVAAGKAVYSVEQNNQNRFSNQHSQSSQSHITKNVFRGQDNIYTQTAISHQTRSQSTLSNSQKIHYKITQTIPFKQTVPVESSTRVPNTYIPPHTTKSAFSFTPTVASKQVFTYPEVLISANEVRNSTLSYRDTDKRRHRLPAKDSSKERQVLSHDNRHVDVSKERESTDLFLKGLHLSNFESNDMNQPDYRLHDRPEIPVRRRKSPASYRDFPALRNYNKLVVDFSKLAMYNETKLIYKNRNEHDTKTESNADTKLIQTTLTPTRTVQLNNAPQARAYTPNNTKQPFLIQETEQRRQNANLSVAKDSLKYQSTNKQNDAKQTAAQKAYVLTEIENRPPVNHDIPHPPLQTVYPKSIQNNAQSRVVNRPTQYRPPAIPHSLPSIVHEPSNTVATIHNVPTTFAGPTTTTINAQRFSSLPVITSTYSNRESFSHANANAREKVIVKVVKAAGFYLNDANERRSYFDAVAHGLLGDNGLVYVNNVQKESSATQLVQNVPINFTPTNVVPPASPAHAQTSPIQTPPVAYSPKNLIPPALLHAQTGSPSGNTAQPFGGINYTPCNCIHAQSVQPPQPLAHTQIQSRAISHHHDQMQSNTNDNLYLGRSSYSVDLKSVGRLAGDNNKHQYNLASLRPQPTKIAQ